MVDDRIETEFKRVLDAVTALLKPLGFSKRGRSFFRHVDGNLALIEFQRSIYNHLHSLKFTINVGIILGKLADREWDIKKSNIADAHLRERIGMFLSIPRDRWWTFDTESSTDSADLAIGEILPLLRDRALPYLNQNLSDDALITLWESGRSPGLTETLRTRYLAKLKQATSNLTP